MEPGLVVFLLYLALLAAHARAGARATRDVRSFHVADRRLGGWTIGFSFFATFVSTNSFVGLTGMSSRLGLATWGIGLVFVAAAWFSWTVVAPSVRRLSERYDALSLPELFGAAYRSPALRRAAALVVLAAGIPYLQAVYKGQALALSALVGLDERVALVAVWLLVLLYTVAGGFHAVARTDAVQGVLLLLAAVGLPLALVRRAGGLEELLAASERAVGLDRSEWAAMGPPAVVAAYALAGAFKLLTEPRQVARFFAVDRSALRRARFVAVCALAVAYAALLPVGLLAAGVMDLPEDPDRIVPGLLAHRDVVPPALGAIVLAALLAAGMSSVDSVLLVLGAVVERDLRRQRTHSADEAELRSTRRWIAFLSIPPLLGALGPGGAILDLTTFAGGLFGAAFLPPILALALPGDPSGKRRGVLSGSALGVLVYLAWLLVAQRRPDLLLPLAAVPAGAFCAALPLLPAAAAALARR